MISNMPLFQTYSAMARHAAESQRVSAANLANADTPGFKGVEIESFQDFVERSMNAQASGSFEPSFRLKTSDVAASPNGNTVSLEQEMFKSAEAMGQHTMALNVYSKSLDLLRTAVGVRR